MQSSDTAVEVSPQIRSLVGSWLYHWLYHWLEPACLRVCVTVLLLSEFVRSIASFTTLRRIIKSLFESAVNLCLMPCLKVKYLIYGSY